MDEDLDDLLEQLEKSDEEEILIKKKDIPAAVQKGKELKEKPSSTPKKGKRKTEKKKPQTKKKKSQPGRKNDPDPAIFNSSDSDDANARSLLKTKKKRETKSRATPSSNQKRRKKKNPDLLDNKTDKIWLELRSGQSLLNRMEKIVIPTEPAPKVQIDLEKFKKKRPSILTPRDLEERDDKEVKEDEEELELELTSGDEAVPTEQVPILLNVSTLQEPILETLDLQTQQTSSLPPKETHHSSPTQLPTNVLKLELTEQTQTQDVDEKPKTLEELLFEEFGITEKDFTKLLDESISEDEIHEDTITEGNFKFTEDSELNRFPSLKRQLSGVEAMPMSKRRRTTRLLSSLREAPKEEDKYVISQESEQSEEESSSSEISENVAVETTSKSQSLFSSLQSASQDFVNNVMGEDTYTIGITNKRTETQTKDANYFNHEQIISNLKELQDKENKKTQKTKSTSVFFTKKAQSKSNEKKDNK